MYCNNISLGNNCGGNKLYCGVTNVTFGNNAQSNIIETGIANITFANGAVKNRITGISNNIMMGNSILFNTFNNAFRISFHENADLNNDGTGLQSCIFNNCNDVTLQRDDTKRINNTTFEYCRTANIFTSTLNGESYITNNATGAVTISYKYTPEEVYGIIASELKGYSASGASIGDFEEVDDEPNTIDESVE